MPKPISVQLYSLREQAKEDFPGVLKTVAEIGYTGVETAGLHGLSAKELRTILDDLGLKASSAHVPLFDDSKTNEIIEDAATLGYRDVAAGFGPKEFQSEEQIRANAEKLNQAVERFEGSGLRLHYHNHWWEYDAPNKGELLLELCPKVGPQFDIYWLATAGQDPAALIKKYGDRSILLHVKDGPCDKDQNMTAVGKGKVDIAASMKAADETPIEWAIVEIDRCDGDMVEAIQESYRYLTENGLATGNK